MYFRLASLGGRFQVCALLAHHAEGAADRGCYAGDDQTPVSAEVEEAENVREYILDRAPVFQDFT